MALRDLIRAGFSARQARAVLEGLAGAGGGITQAYVGRSTQGGAWEAISAVTYLKKFTLADAGWLGSIAAFVRANSSQVGGWDCSLFADNAGVQGDLIATSTGYRTDTLLLDSARAAGRWLDQPIGAWLAAGDYWMGIRAMDTGSFDIALDATGGSDRTQAITSWTADGSSYAQTATSKDYSIRGTILR